MDSQTTPFAKAVEDFIVETSQKADKSCDFYREVLAEVNSGSVRRDSPEQSKRCAQHLATFVENLQVKHQRNKITRRVSDRLQPLISGLSQYTGVCDVLIQAGPMGAVLLYGGARLILQLAQNFSSLFDTVIGILEDVGYDLQCYGLFATAYKSSVEVQELLVQSYKNIILLWQDISKLLGSKTYKIIFRNVAQPMTTKWQTCKDALRRDRDRVLILTQAVEAESRRRKDEEAKRESATLRQREKIGQVAAWIKSHCLDQDLDHQTTARTHAEKRYTSTCDWILKHSTYQDWLSSSTEAVLLTGPPGIGKTIWASTVIQDLEARGLHTACFFFSFSDPKQCDSMNALRSLALSLLRFYDYVPERVQNLYDADMKNRYVELHVLDTAVQVVRALIKKISRIHIVLDGLDECVGTELQKLCTVLDQLLIPERYGGVAKWLFTSQPRSEILKCIQKHNVQIVEAPQESLLNDVRLYVTHIMETRLNTTCSHCIESLVSDSEGNFQWTSYTLRVREWEGPTCDEEMDEALRKSHRGLTNCYKRNLHQLKTRSKSERELARKIFAVLAVSAQPLRLSEISQALAAINCSNKLASDYNPRRVPPSNVIRELCSGFIRFDASKSSRDDPFLKFGHKSIRDFFVDNPQELEIPTHDELFFTSSEKAKEQLGLACLRYLSFKRYISLNNIQHTVAAPDHAFLKHAATFWHSYLTDAAPSMELFDEIRNFVLGPTFWNCIAIQSHVAPHLFGCYVGHSEYGYSLEAVRPSDRAGGDICYGVPLPHWLDSFNAKGEQVSKRFYTLVKQWHPILNSHHAAIRECIMDSVWDEHNPCRTVWRSNRSTAHFLHPSRPTDTRAPGHRTEQIRSVKSLSAGKLAVATIDRKLEIDALLVELTRWTIQYETVVIDSEITSKFTGKKTETAMALTLLTGPCRKAYDIPLLPNNFKVETELGTIEIGLSDGSQCYWPLRYSERSWTITSHFKTDPGIENQQLPGVEVLYGVSGSTKHSVEKESEIGSSDSESDHMSLYSDEDSDPAVESAVEDATSDGKTESNRFILIVCPEKAHVWSTWTSQFACDTTRVAVHPAGRLVIWSPLPYEMRIADLDSGEVKSIPLPEPPGISWASATAVCKEFHFSENGEILHYLLYTADRLDPGIRQKVSVLSFIFSTQENDRYLTQLGSACSVEHVGIGDLHSSFVLTAWTTDAVYLALPPLFCNPKVLRLRLSSASTRQDSDAVNFETLKDQIYFPSSTTERNPKLFVFAYENKEELVLALDAEVPEIVPSAADAEQSSLQPPTVFVWNLDNSASDWRKWDPTCDAESAEQQASQDSYKRLRGNYVDSDQRFTVPIRSGLNWRRQAFVSCS